MIFLGGPARSVTCGACREALDLPADAWRSVVESGLTELDGSSGGVAREHMLWCRGLRFSFRVALDQPRCGGCGAGLDIAAALANPARAHCGQCGQIAGFTAAPEWFRAANPDARALFGAQDEAAEEREQTAPRPVVMTCANCGAKLEIQSETERVTTCAYCQADHYVPDDVWRRLHPAKKRTPWFVIFGDPQKADAAASPVELARIACAKCGKVVAMSTTYVTGGGTVCEACFNAGLGQP